MRHGEPDLVAGERENRRKELGERVKREIQGGLRTAAGCAVRFVAVEAILDDVQIERGERGDAEVVDDVGDDVEFIVPIRRGDLSMRPLSIVMSQRSSSGISSGAVSFSGSKSTRLSSMNLQVLRNLR